MESDTLLHRCGFSLVSMIHEEFDSGKEVAELYAFKLCRDTNLNKTTHQDPKTSLSLN